MQLQDFSQHYTTYLNHLQQQGKSIHTISAYRRDLNQLSHLLSTEPQFAHEEPHRRHFTMALKKLSQQGQHPRSMMRKLSVWHQYCHWLIQQGLLQIDPTETLKAPKAPSRLPKAIEQESLNHLLDTAIETDDLSLRDIAIFELMYGSGLRLSEIHYLNIDDVLLNEGWVHVTGKGNKQRQVPLVSKSVEAIREYLPHRHAQTGELALFTSNQGNRLSQRQIQNRLRNWAIKQGSPQHISPHMLRHSYASHLLQSARDIRAVQELLGHSNLSTTQIYTKLDFDHLAQIYDETHPRAKRKK